MLKNDVVVLHQRPYANRNETKHLSTDFFAFRFDGISFRKLIAVAIQF